jgi:hypothetical protein
MIHSHAPKPLSVANPSEVLALHTKRLTGEQFARLSRCAEGISLRFEASEFVDALILDGYAEKGVAGVVTVTVKGRQYLRTHASQVALPVSS